MSFKNNFVFSILLIILSCNVVQANNTEPTTIVDLYSAFYGAIEDDNFFEIQQLVSFGIDINHRYENGITPLMLASKMGSVRSIKSLLELGAEIDLRSGEGKTAIDYAQLNGDKLTIAILKANPKTNQQLIKEIQYYLRELGYNTGAIDGKLGPSTSKALSNFTNDINQVTPASITQRQLESLKKELFDTQL